MSVVCHFAYVGSLMYRVRYLGWYELRAMSAKFRTGSAKNALTFMVSHFLSSLYPP